MHGKKSGGGGGGGAKKEKKAKDPNAPKRAPSAYMTFCATERKNVIAAHPELASQVTEVAKKLGAKWGSLSDAQKADWKKKADALA